LYYVHYIVFELYIALPLGSIW